FQPDGKTMIVGWFTTIAGHNQPNIARLNADGSFDATFVPAATDGAGVGATAVQPDGKVIIAGGFSTVGGVSRPNLARLNADGSLDIGYAPPPPNALVRALAVRPDNTVLIAGDFTSVGGQPRPGFARLLADGTADPCFAAPSTDGLVFGLAEQGGDGTPG